MRGRIIEPKYREFNWVLIASILLVHLGVGVLALELLQFLNRYQDFTAFLMQSRFPILVYVAFVLIMTILYACVRMSVTIMEGRIDEQ